MFSKYVDGEVHHGQQQSADRPHPLRALHDRLMPLHALLEFVQTSGLAVAKQGRHLRFQDGKIGEDLGFKIGHI
jgi:hypothetical protein